MSETQKGIISLSTSGKEDRQTEATVVQSAETIHQHHAEEGDSSSFIPWRKHLLETEEPENLMQEPPSPEEKLSLNPGSPPENQEGQSVNENRPVTEGSLATCSANLGENVGTRVGKAKRMVEYADANVQVFKESFDILKECCDNMCLSMLNLQDVLETLIQILKE